MRSTEASPLRRSGGLRPRWAVAVEFLRALAALALGPLRIVGYLFARARLQREVAGDLLAATPPDEPPHPALSADDAVRVFISCAEPSGELHARHLLVELRRAAAAAGAPAVEFSGLGGERLGADGVRRVGDPVARAAMGLGAVAALPFYLRLLTGAARELRDARPDLLVAVDSPALHVPLGALARRYGVPVVHFVTPQYWAWAPWRVGGYGRAVDLGLSILPFEPAWFARHRVRAAHVGHPICDALANVEPNPEPDHSDLLVLLPGSRASVLRRNLPWMLLVAAQLRLRQPNLRVALPHDRTELEPLVRELLDESGASDWVELRFGALHPTLREARAALSVSGTVLLDLLHHRLPTVAVYRVGTRFEAWLARHLLTVPYFASINLLAGREVCPEHCFSGDGPRDRVVDDLEGLWIAGPEREAARAGLDLAAERLGPPGANARAARWALAAAGGGASDG